MARLQVNTLGEPLPPGQPLILRRKPIELGRKSFGCMRQEGLQSNAQFGCHFGAGTQNAQRRLGIRFE